MAQKLDGIDTIEEIYSARRDAIRLRMEEFKRLWHRGDDREVFAELVFCILTPQSKAKLCWNAVSELLRGNLLLDGELPQIAQQLNGVRFKNRKAGFIVEARRIFTPLDSKHPTGLTNYGKLSIKTKLVQLDGAHKIRGWLVQNVKGLGYKEASHFLRNIGLGENFAILDRHILKNLKALGVIEKIPVSLTGRNYIEIENKLKLFSKKVNIPVSHLDLLFWSKETGEIFK